VHRQDLLPHFATKLLFLHVLCIVPIVFSFVYASVRLDILVQSMAAMRNMTFIESLCVEVAIGAKLLQVHSDAAAAAGITLNVGGTNSPLNSLHALVYASSTRERRAES